MLSLESTFVSYAINPTDGTRIYYEVTGEGPALIFLHGSALSRVIWRGLGYLKGLPGYTHIRIDARGHGKSDKPHEPSAYAMERLAEDVLAVMDAEQTASAGIVGYSLGARTGWQLMTTAPTRFAAFVALAGSHRKQTGEIKNIFYPGYLETLKNGDIDAFVAGFGPGLDRATALAFKSNDPLALYAMFAEMEDAERSIPDTLIAQVSAPVLAMAGDQDPRRYADSQDQAQIAQNCRFHPLPGRNHAGTLFYAQDNLAVIKPFLDKNYPGTA